MNTPAVEKLRRMLAANQPAYGLWVTLDSASVSDIAVALGLDWLVIDAEHGHLDFKEILGHIRSAVRSETVVLVRVSELSEALIKRVLDIGADGVVVPRIESADQLRRAVSYVRYPPAGVRGIGAERATGWGQCFVEHAAEADENLLVVPLIESVQAGENIEVLCGVPGVDVMFLGPADYSASAGHAGQWQGPGVADQLLSIKDTIVRHGKHCGIVATDDEDLLRRRGQGFGMLGLGMDTGLLIRGLRESLRRVDRGATISPTLVPRPERAQP